MLPDLPHPVILAHRGACVRAPENTLAAFELALAEGADGIELDAKLSADQQVVVMHDTTVDRTTGGHGRIASMNLSELRQLDASAAFHEKYHGEKIPTLEDVFEAVGRKMLINVELTNYATPGDALVEKVCQLVRKHGLEKNVIFSSFLAVNLKKAAARLPGIPLGLLALRGWMGAWARSFGFSFGDYFALHAHVRDVTPQQVQRVHKLKRRLHVWTVNQAEDMQHLNSWGADGILTDDPILALQKVGRRP